MENQEKAIKKLKLLRVADKIASHCDFVPEFEDLESQLDDLDLKCDLEDIKFICKKYVGYGYESIADEILATIDEL